MLSRASAQHARPDGRCTSMDDRLAAWERHTGLECRGDSPSRTHPARFGACGASAAGRHRLSTRCGCAGMTHELCREGDLRVAPLRLARAAPDGEIARNHHFWCVLVEFGRARRCSRARRGSRWLVRDARPTPAPVARAPTSVHARSASISGENVEFWPFLAVFR